MYRILPLRSEHISVNLPQSKSLSHRIAILAGLNSGQTTIVNPLIAEDTQITVDALKIMGMLVVEQANQLHVTAPIGTTVGDTIYLGNSGSSARFLLPLAAYVDHPLHFSGVKRLHKRPFSELFGAMEILGIRYQAEQNSLPATIYPGKIKGGTVIFKELPSSQIVTALMMSALWMEDDLHIRLPGEIPSLPYIQMTEKLLDRLGQRVESRGADIWVEAKHPEFDWMYAVEKDMSAASFWVVLGLINNIPIVLENMTLPTLQGDERIFEIAEQVGGRIVLFENHVEISGQVNKNLDIDCSDIPDLVPSLSILALFAPEPSVFRNIKHLEYKESNRIAAIRSNINQLGGSSTYTDGNLSIKPAKKYSGTVITSHNDHRIAMSFAVAGTRIEDIIIDQPSCVQKSYPDFWQDFMAWEGIN